MNGNCRRSLWHQDHLVYGNLVMSRTSIAGRARVRRLYIARGLFVIVTAVSLIL